MSGHLTVILASKSSLKENAVRKGLKNIIGDSFTLKTVDSQPKTVPAQPIGREEIFKGASERLGNVKGGSYITVSIESGIETCDEKWFDVSCIIVRTHWKTYVMWTERYTIDESKYDMIKKVICDQSHTFGELAYPEHPTDWYPRQYILGIIITDMFNQVFYCSPDLMVPKIKLFKNVKFLDLQDWLLKDPKMINKSIEYLAKDIPYDKVIVLDARGFLFASFFMEKGIPVVLARKANKIPDEMTPVMIKKEYGDDLITIQKGSIKEKDKILIVDDVIATGGTIKGVNELVKKCGASVSAVICLAAVVDDSGEHLYDNFLNVRYLVTTDSVYTENMRDCIQFVKRQKKRRNILKNRDECDYALIIPPSLERLNIEGNILEVRWGSYGTTPNIWFNSKGIAEKDIYIYINLSDPGETFNVLMLSSIIYRHDPKKIYIIIPFLDHGTQDRVEYEDEYDEEERRDIVQMESMAAVDTVAKIIPKGIKVITFDIHNIQSAWAYDNIINIPVLRHLFIKYLTDSKTDNQNLVVVFPDEGSYKRFSKDISKAPNGKHYVKTSIIFFKKRGLGDERIVQPMTDIESEEKKGYVIVDDMVRSGGTMKSVIKYLKDKENTLFVDLLFTHAAYESKTKENLELADRIWTTNTTGKDKSPQMLVADFLSLE